VHFGEVQVKMARAHCEGWVGVAIRIITNFSWVDQSSRVPSVVEKGGDASLGVD